MILYTESMHYFYTLFFFIFGSLLGSFSNVVVLRMAISKSVIFPPSACPKCDHQLHAIDLVPIFSWLSLRGKCRYCKAPISIQYPLVESFMAIIISFSFYKTGLDLQFIWLASSMAIWFVVSTIFVREEVLRHQPFIWAILYSLLLKYLIIGKAVFNSSLIITVVISLLVGYVAYIKKKKIVEFTRWSCLAFLPLFYFHFNFVTAFFLLLVLGLLEENTEKAYNQAKWVFYSIQLVGIILNIYLTNFIVTFTQISN